MPLYVGVIRGPGGVPIRDFGRLSDDGLGFRV